MTRPITVESMPTNEQLWQAMRVLFGIQIQAATLTVLTRKDDGDWLFTTYVIPQTETP